MRIAVAVRPVVLAALLGTLAAATCGSALAQKADGVLRIVVPIPAGGAPDLLARIVGTRLASATGRSLVIEHLLGANGSLAARGVADAAPNGRTLLLAQDTLVVVNPHVYGVALVDPRRELVPVGSVASNAFALLVPAASPIRDIAGLVAAARTAKPVLAYASGGNGSQSHLMMERLRQVTGIELLHVPFRGGVPATLATSAAEVAMSFAGASARPEIEAGRLRAISVTGRTRSDAYPGVPTLREFHPELEMEVWLGLFAPARTPSDTLSRLAHALAPVLDSAEVREAFSRLGALKPLVLSPERFAERVRADDLEYGALVRRLGLRIE